MAPHFDPVVRGPEFDRIRGEAGSATEQALQLMWRMTLDTYRGATRTKNIRWQHVLYESGNFVSVAGTWTVAAADQKLFDYMLLGTVMWITFNLVETTTDGSVGNELRIRIPEGKRATTNEHTGYLRMFDSGNGGTYNEAGSIFTRPAPNEQYIALFRDDFAAWPTSETNNLDVRGAIMIDVQ